MVACALGSGMLQAGCLLPTSLEYERDPPNVRPSFVVDRCTPRFGPLTLTVNDSVELSLVAEDANPNDTLFWRLFRPSATGGPDYTFTFIEGTFVATASGDPNVAPLRTAQVFPGGRRLCTTFPSTELIVIVGDREFCNPPAQPTGDDCTHESQVPAGLSDENHWTLVCR